jgi:molybdenum cofactor cytidylyltransferase
LVEMDEKRPQRVTAIVLAAGLSTRMGGQPKPLLRYGDRTVLEHILHVLGETSIVQICIVTGYRRDLVQELVKALDIRTVFNPEFSSGEMLTSIQVGLRAVGLDSDAALIVLGDQPSIQTVVVESILKAHCRSSGAVIIPSFQHRRGHPILIPRKHWNSILNLSIGQSLRDLFREIEREIAYVQVDTPGVLRDIDNPEDYRRELDLLVSTLSR